DGSGRIHPCRRTQPERRNRCHPSWLPDLGKRATASGTVTHTCLRAERGAPSIAADSRSARSSRTRRGPKRVATRQQEKKEAGQGAEARPASRVPLVRLGGSE